MNRINIKGQQVCAFCRHWYDPTNAAIKPVAPAGGFWEYDPNRKNICSQLNLQKEAGNRCPRYECKIND